MKRILNYEITEEFSGYSILGFLKKNGYTHNVITHLKKTEHGIVLNDHWAYVTEKLNVKDQLLITIIEEELQTSIIPIFGNFEIIYEDEDILVINKPAGMPIHPSMGYHENTLANAVLYYFKESGNLVPFRCMNRLDRDTTGLTVIAKHMLAAGALNDQMKNRQVHRTYFAICEGKVNPSGTIDAPIARKDDSTVERCINYEHGEHAITHYTLISYDAIKDLSYVKLSLDTGRTHQIRVHMKYIGHPLIGDFLYNPNYAYIHRQALHAGELSFIHPITKEKMHFSSDLPIEMKCILAGI